MVPKFLPTPDGKPGVRNEVECVSIEHKVGIHASPTCVMSFGQDVGATGYLLGNLHQGIRAMFTMMNDARLNVGLEGLGTTERVLQQAGDFASERRQGRAPAGVDAVPIVEHPDVRRMLATIRAHSEAMRGLLYDNAARFDAEHHHGDPDHASRAGAVGRLLTPVSKAWCTDLAVEMASLGIQVHGGMGYVEETGAAQLWRDSRISPIYEGTNGIQAIDLVMRKLPADGGTIVRSYLEEIDAAASRAAGAGLSTISTNLHDAFGALATATEWLLAAPDPGDRLAGASPYLRMFGTVAGARYLTDAAVAAVRLSNGGDPDGYYRAKIATADFFTAQIPARSQSPRACRHRRHRKPGKWRRFCHTRAMTFDTAPRAAAFFDLDRTIISGSSVFTFGYVAYRNGMLPRSDLIKDLVSAILFQFHRRFG